MSYLPPDKDSRVGPRTLTIAAIVFGVVAVAMVVLTIVQSQSLASATEQAQNDLAATKAQYDEVVLNREASSGSSASSTITLYTAFKDGEELAALQSQAPAAYRDKEDDPDLYAETVVPMRELLGLAEDALPPIWYDTSKFKRVPRWVFLSAYETADTTCDVAWELRDSSQGELVFAYVTATYDAQKHTFSDVKVYQTAAGKRTLEAAAAEAGDEK